MWRIFRRVIGIIVEKNRGKVLTVRNGRGPMYFRTEGRGFEEAHQGESTGRNLAKGEHR